MIRADDAQVIAFAAELDALNALLPPAERVYAYKVGANGYGRNAVPMFSRDADFWSAVNDVQTATGHRRYFEQQAARNPVKADKPFRAWIGSPCFSGSWDFATREEAEGYLLAQIERKGGRVYIGGAPAGPDAVDPMQSFVQGPEGVVSTLYEMGWSRRAADRTWTYFEPVRIVTTYDAGSLESKSRVVRVTAILELVHPLDADDIPGALERLASKIERNVSNVETATVFAGLVGQPSPVVVKVNSMDALKAEAATRADRLHNGDAKK